MATRSSVNWGSIPGNYDVLHADMSYESDNKYNIPDILPQDFVPQDLVMYGTEVRRGYASTKGKCVHFFLDDYKFEPLWNKPIKTLGTIERIGQALSPDFSIYVNDPLVMQMWNTYRSRWLGRFWQENGIQVIPTVVWGDERSYDFCFEGIAKNSTVAIGNTYRSRWLGRFWQENGIQVIPTVVWGDERSYDFCFEGIAKNSTVAIGTVGVRSAEAKALFIQGFYEMIKRLEPKTLIVYGEHMPIKFEDYVENVYYYDSYWKKRRKELVND